jgi:hypothetical protein
MHNRIEGERIDASCSIGRADTVQYTPGHPNLIEAEFVHQADPWGELEAGANPEIEAWIESGIAVHDGLGKSTARGKGESVESLSEAGPRKQEDRCA